MFRIVSSAEPARDGGALAPVQEEPPDQPGPPWTTPPVSSHLWQDLCCHSEGDWSQYPQYQQPGCSAVGSSICHKL